uniref:SPATA31 domain-containing protein n=1 Tax=Anolis carolinensis TaxID=28377 RepID=A0A803SLI0_ANOCA
MACPYCPRLCCHLQAEEAAKSLTSKTVNFSLSEEEEDEEDLFLSSCSSFSSSSSLSSQDLETSSEEEEEEEDNDQHQPRKRQWARRRLRKLKPVVEGLRTLPFVEEGHLDGVKSGRAGRDHQHPPFSNSTAPKDGSLHTSHPFQVRIRVHSGKKSLQTGHKTIPKLVVTSQKTTAPEEEVKRPMPKLILHNSRPECSGPSLLLRWKTNCVVMNLKCKSLQVVWNHQTQCHQSLPKTALIPLQPRPDIPPRRHGVVEFRGVKTPYCLHRARQLLESHRIGGKLWHQRGQPRLVPWSLGSFDVLLGSSQSFICRETAQQLDNHIKRKMAERVFGLPRRVMDSLNRFMPAPLAIPEVPTDNREASTSLQSEISWTTSTAALSFIQGQCPGSGQPSTMQRLISKYSVQIHLKLAGVAFKVPPVTADQVRECQSLPKMISRGMKTHQLRTQELSFVEREALGHLELNLIHKDLIFKWGLPTLYQTSLSFLSASVWCQAGPPSSTWRSTSVGFPSTKTLWFIGQGAQMELEWHIRWKRLQHLWGLPRLVQRSLRRLSPEAPHMQRPGQMEVVVLPAQLSFLSDVTKQQLERNLRKRIIFRQWCLPKRVLESLWLLCPEMVRTVDVERRLRSRAEPAPRQPRVFPTPRCEALEKMVLHLEKKCLEVQLGVPLALTQPPSPTLRRPLPQKIFPGQRCPKPRSHSLTFGRQEDMDRLELTLRHNHLTSLWGRGTRFLEDLGPRAPRAPSCFQPPRPKQAKALPLSEEETPFLQTQEREALELHVKSKRLRHEWRLPGLLERSLSGFRPAPRLQTGPSKLGISIDVLRQDPCFLPQSTFQRLDFHLQRMKLQRQWGLPKRVLGSLKGLCPGIMVGPPDVHQTEDGVALSQGPGHHVNPGLSIPGRTEGKLLPMLAPNIMNRMEVHWARKSMEVHLELVPDMVRRSWLQMPLLSRQPLPRNIPPGLMPQKVRTSSFPFLHAGELDKIEMSVKCHHMAFLWGLGTLHVEALSGMMEPKPTPEHPGPRGSCIAFSESETPFLLEEERQALETHVSTKKIHHAWALPGLAQKSIMAFMPEPPQAPFHQKTTIDIEIIPGELSFLSQKVSSVLEFHIHKRTIKQQWGLPRRVLQSLRLMAPRDGSHHQEPSDGQSWRSSLQWPVHGETPIGSWPMGARGAEQDILRRGAESILNTEILRKMAKKGTEMFFEAPSTATEASCEDGGPQTGQAFLKVIPAGHGTRKPQSTSLTRVSHKEMGRMELDVQSHHLSPLWGMSKTYKEGLPGMGRASSNLPHKYRQVDIEFLEIQTPFILKEVREALELHVTKKRIQHAWALPGLVQTSVMAFMPEPPQAPFHQKTTIDIEIIPGELSFLSQEVSSVLEFHIHKRTIKQQWGLPRRVLQSLRLMAPRDGGLHQEPSDGQSRRSSLRGLGLGTTTIGSWPMDARGTAQEILKKRGAVDMLDAERVKKVEHHVAKKHMEIHFRVSSVDTGVSGEDGGPLARQSLPKLIPPGHGSRQPRSTALTMVSHKEMGRMELAVQRCHLASLWGLVGTYIEGLAGMGPGLSTRLPRYTQVDVEFLEIETPFLPKDRREALEFHVTWKRIHHTWSLPGLVQRSLQAFLAPSLLVPTSKDHPVGTVQEIGIQSNRPSFFSDSVQKDLEASLKKMAIRRQWGLPKRVQNSLRAVSPATPATRAQWPHQEESRSAKPARGGHGLKMETTPPREGPRQKKAVQRLSKLDPVFRQKQLRSPFLPFLEEKMVDMMDMNIRYKYLRYLWGFPSDHAGSLYWRHWRAKSRPNVKKVPMTTKTLEIGRAPMVPKGHGVRNQPRSMAKVSAGLKAMDPTASHKGNRELEEFYITQKKICYQQGLQNFSATLNASALKTQVSPETPEEETLETREEEMPLLGGSQGIEQTLSERSSISGESSPQIIEEPREQPQRKLHGRHLEAKASTGGQTMDLRAFQEGNRGLLEFHIMHKQICRRWQDSLAAYSPPDFTFQVNTEISPEETLETTEKEMASSEGSHEVTRVWSEQRSQLWDKIDATDGQSRSTTTEGRSSSESVHTSEGSAVERVLAVTPEPLSPSAAKEETVPDTYLSSWATEDYSTTDDQGGLLHPYVPSSQEDLLQPSQATTHQTRIYARAVRSFFQLVDIVEDGLVVGLTQEQKKILRWRAREQESRLCSGRGPTEAPTEATLDSESSSWTSEDTNSSSWTTVDTDSSSWTTEEYESMPGSPQPHDEESH